MLLIGATVVAVAAAALASVAHAAASAASIPQDWTIGQLKRVSAFSGAMPTKRERRADREALGNFPRRGDDVRSRTTPPAAWAASSRSSSKVHWETAVRVL